MLLCFLSFIEFQRLLCVPLRGAPLCHRKRCSHSAWNASSADFLIFDLIWFWAVGWTIAPIQRRHFGGNGASLFLMIIKIIVCCSLIMHTLSLDLSMSPPSLYICFLCYFHQDHSGPPFSLLPLIVCHSPSFHPSFFHLSLSQGDLGRAHLPSSPSPSIPCES